MSRSKKETNDAHPESVSIKNERQGCFGVTERGLSATGRVKMLMRIAPSDPPTARETDDSVRGLMDTSDEQLVRSDDVSTSR